MPTNNFVQKPDMNSEPTPDIISAALRKQIAALSKTKNRREQHLFVAEGTKCVLDTLEAFNLRHIIATAEWFGEHPRQAALPQAVLARKADMERITSLSTPPPVIAVYETPSPGQLRITSGTLYLALDCIQDPGNLGTIIRTADWMGITDIIASHDTADAYSAKTIQSTMGAISRVNIHYCDLPATLGSLHDNIAVYGTFLDGENIYSAPLTSGGILVMGNEGRGISPAVAETITHRITIPSYPAGRPTSESLNVATATAICIALFRAPLLR